MCRYFSCIVTRNLKVYWSKSGPNHEAIIREAKLDDTKLEDRDFVRIEITPQNLGKVSRSPEDWTLALDEPSTIPDWFMKKRKQAEQKCWLAWKESVKVQIALGEEECTARDGYMVAWDSSHVEAWGSSHVEAWGSSHVEAWGSSHVEAWDSSHVVAWDSSHVVAWDLSHVVARGSSHVVARGSSHVEARGSSHVVAWGSSHVVAWGSSHVEAWGSSHVELKSRFASILNVATGEILVHAEAKVKVTSERTVP